MKNLPLLSALSDARIAKVILTATRRVVYAAPGIQEQPANALMVVIKKETPPYLTVSLDFDERTLRMGYGIWEPGSDQ